MLRIARSCRGEIINSLEQVSKPRLGSCAVFEVHSYNLPNGMLENPITLLLLNLQNNY